MTSKNEDAKTKKPNPITETPEFKKLLKDGIANATSTYQRDASQANQKANNLTKQLRETNKRLGEIEGKAKLADIVGENPDLEEAAQRLITAEAALNERLAGLDERDESIKTMERKFTIDTLVAETGIPKEQLESLQSLAEMENAALRWERDQYRDGTKAPASKAAEGDKGGDGDDDEPEGESDDIENGDGRTVASKVPDPISDPEGWAKYKEAAQTEMANAER